MVGLFLESETMVLFPSLTPKTNSSSLRFFPRSLSVHFTVVVFVLLCLTCVRRP
jgi:hypothetical protein